MLKNYAPEVALATSIFEAFHCLTKAFNEQSTNETIHLKSNLSLTPKNTKITETKKLNSKKKVQNLNPEIDE